MINVFNRILIALERIAAALEMRATTESWVAVKGYEGLYEVSNLGRVRSLPRVWEQCSRIGTVYKHLARGKLLRPGLTGAGYPSVVLGRGHTRTVHQLVAEAFIGPRPKGQEVRHKNGVRTDARAANLEYGTRLDNIKDAMKHGTFWSGRDKTRKLPTSEIQQIRDLYRSGGLTYKDIAHHYGVSSSAIGFIIRGRKRRCG